MNQANPTPKTEIQKLPKEMKYPKYLVLITCTLLLGSYFWLYRTNLLPSIKIITPLEENKILTFFESELIKNYPNDDLSQANKVIYTSPDVALPDVAQGDILEITFDYETTPTKLTQGIPIALITISQGNQELTKYYLKSQLRSKQRTSLPLNSNLEKKIRLKVELTGTATFNLYSLSFTRSSPKN